ncbi:cytochrome c family protein [Anaeromyxobacter sp. Red801]|uniref:cytochrome c family protein n=1 Tax=Anaeromyxobacter sp. Red801 TaxID=3411632 RepID=UPI003B9DFD07
MLPALRLPLLAAVLALPPAARAAGDKVGPEACKACHPSAYERWRVSPHARALEVLPAERREDPRCLSCHAPDREDGLAGVSCETCHGPGRAYAADYVMRDRELARAVGLVDPGPKTCLACHTDSTPSLLRFDPKRKLPLIDHWTPHWTPAPGDAAVPAGPRAPARPAPAPARRPGGR